MTGQTTCAFKAANDQQDIYCTEDIANKSQAVAGKPCLCFILRHLFHLIAFGRLDTKKLGQCHKRYATHNIVGCPQYGCEDLEHQRTHAWLGNLQQRHLTAAHPLQRRCQLYPSVLTLMHVTSLCSGLQHAQMSGDDCQLGNLVCNEQGNVIKAHIACVKIQTLT